MILSMIQNTTRNQSIGTRKNSKTIVNLMHLSISFNVILESQSLKMISIAHRSWNATSHPDKYI